MAEIDWASLYRFFINNKVELKDLSREETGDENAPSYSRLRVVAGKAKWIEDQSKTLKAREPKPVKPVSPPLPPPPIVLANSIPSLSMGAIEAIAQDLHRPPGMIHEGHYTDALPGAMQPGYEDAISDGELLGMRRDIALMNTFSRSLLKRMNDGEPSAKHWGRLRQISKEMSEAYREKDMATVAKKTNDLLKAIALGCPESELMSEILEVTRTRMNLIGAESRRLQALQAYALKQKQIDKDEKTEMRSAEGGDDSRGLGQESRDETMRRVWEIVT